MLIETAAGLAIAASLVAIAGMFFEGRRARQWRARARQRGQQLKCLRDSCSIRTSRGRMVAYRSAPMVDRIRAEQPK